MTNNPEQLRQLLDSLKQNLWDSKLISQFVSQYGASNLQQQQKQQIVDFWRYPTISARFILKILDSYQIFENSITIDDVVLSQFSFILNVSTVCAENQDITSSMIQMQYMLYFFPLLQSEHSPEQLKHMIFSFFLALSKNQDSLGYLIKNEVVSVLIFSLRHVKAPFCSDVLKILALVEENQFLYKPQVQDVLPRLNSLCQCLKKFSLLVSKQQADQTNNVLAKQLLSKIISQIDKLQKQ